MSNISKQLIKIEDGVDVNIQNRKVIVNGSKGMLETQIPTGINVEIADGQIKITKMKDLVELEKFAGLARALIANTIIGVSKGFDKKLELTGVGYRARIDGTDLVLNVGFSLPVKIVPVDGVSISVEENVITVAGINKQLVGDVAANIRKVRPPDPYKGKGIRYQGEHIRRKVGKAAKAVGAAK
jgi:large subunit ribosomal protein L6